MKLLLVVENINKVGGIERVINVLSNYFYSEFNYDVEIVSIFTKENDSFFNFSPKIKITHCKESYKSFSKRKDESKYYNNVLKDILTNRDFDIVMTFYTHISKAVIINKKFIGKSKIIVTEHIDYYKSSFVGRMIKGCLYRKVDKFIVLSDAYKELYSRYLNNVVTISNPIAFTTERTSKLINKKIISLGRLDEQKAFDRAIDIFKIIENKCNDWCWEIYGEGSEYDCLNKKIIENKLEGKVIIKPFITNIEEKLIDASIYALTSRYEGLPLVLLEAQECGLPCVSFDILSARPIIKDGINGVMVSDGNIEEFADKLLELINNYEQRKVLGTNAKTNAKQYHVDAICNQWRNLFESIL